jgi:hypothetical protein
MTVDKQVKVYFDVEWISDEQEDGKLPGIIHVIEEVICARWPAVTAQLLRDGGNNWQGGRHKGRRFKNSFHVVYDTVMVPWNHGDLRRLGRGLAKSMDSRLCVDGVSVVDGNVYNRNQQYRLPRCWKIDDVSSTELQRIELTETGFVRTPSTLQAALRAVATGSGAANTVTVTEDQLDKLDQVALSWSMHALQLDGCWVEEGKLRGPGPLRCPWTNRLHDQCFRQYFLGLSHHFVFFGKPRAAAAGGLRRRRKCWGMLLSSDHFY